MYVCVICTHSITSNSRPYFFCFLFFPHSLAVHWNDFVHTDWWFTLNSSISFLFFLSLIDDGTYYFIKSVVACSLWSVAYLRVILGTASQFFHVHTITHTLAKNHSLSLCQFSQSFSQTTNQQILYAQLRNSVSFFTAATAAASAALQRTQTLFFSWWEIVAASDGHHVYAHSIAAAWMEEAALVNTHEYREWILLFCIGTTDCSALLSLLRAFRAPPFLDLRMWQNGNMFECNIKIEPYKNRNGRARTFFSVNERIRGMNEYCSARAVFSLCCCGGNYLSCKHSFIGIN